MGATIAGLQYRLEYWCTLAERNHCPVVQAARELAVQRWNAYARAAARQSNKGKWTEPGQNTAPLTEYSVMPHRRRRNLSQYDGRRDSVVVDRYYFGIYSSDYFG